MKRCKSYRINLYVLRQLIATDNHWNFRPGK